MPLFKRKPLEREPTSHQALKDNQEVFYCELSKEMFVDYEEYFERTMLFNSTIWTCAVSGRPNLTYAEALESERKHRKLIEAFPQILKGPCVYIANLTKRSAISELVDDVFNYVNPRFFKGEIVSAKEQNTEQFVDCEVVGFVTSIANGNSPTNNKAQNSEDVKYRVKRVDGNGKSPATWCVSSDQLRRKKKKDHSHPFSKDKCKLFLKQCIEYNDIRMLRIKEESYKKYVVDANITALSSFFVGKQPVFELSKQLADKKEKDNKKKQGEQRKVDKKKSMTKEKSDKNKVENGEVKNGAIGIKERKKGKQMSLDQFVTKDAAKLEELKKAKKLEEEEIRKRKELEAERQKLLAEERKKYLAEMLQLVQATVKNLNALKDDLELQDQKPLPITRPIRTLIPDKYFPGALMVQEFIYSYTDILEDKDKFRNGIDLSIMERALLTREVAGPLSDIMQVLLGSIFSFQIEELNEINIQYEKGTIPFKDGISKEQREIVKHATAMATWPKKYLSSNICDLPIDATTLTELLRLHFLTSGARLNEPGTKYRFQERGGYHNTDDPGIIFRIENPHIIKALAEKTVYELPLDDIMAILRCLVNQALTYSSLRDAIEDRLEKSTKAKVSLRILCAAERKREATLAAEKKEILEEVKKNLEAFTGTDEEKASYKENLDKDADNKIKRLEYVAEKDKNKFLADLEKLKREIFDYQLYLGSDRAYRSYWLFESLPGLFIEHAPFGGQCIVNPVENIHGLAYCAPEKRYLFIKNMLHNKQKNNNVNDKENKITNMLEVKPKVSIDANTKLPVEQQTPPPPPPPPEPEINMNLTQGDLLMCTGQSETCPVHSTNDPNRSAWSFLYTEEEINALIDSLNPRGYREKNLKEQLESQRELILFHTKNCPADKLQIVSDVKQEKIEQLGTDKGKTYQNANFNYPKGMNISEILLSEIRGNILELEFKITAGQLGTLRVKDRISWRQLIEVGEYNMQCNYLQWGPFGQFQSDDSGNIKKAQLNGKASAKMNGTGQEEDEENEGDDSNSENGVLNLTYEDPGDGLEAQIENSDVKLPKTEEEELVATAEYRRRVHKLACALLQIAQGIDPRYFKPPFGNLKSAERKNKELATENAKRALEMWTVSLMNCFTPSQLYLHYNVLYDSIKWTRSAQNAKCVCRSSKDPDKLLLCDGCNIGRHIYCLKPKLTKVPEGDWFCSRCKPNKKEPQKKKRKTFVYTEDSEEETQEEEEAEESESDSSGLEVLFSDSATQDSSDTERKVCVRCNKTSRNLFKCSKCERYYDTKCLNLRMKPGRNWSCDVCVENKSNKRRIIDDDSDDEVLATKSSKLNGSLPHEERRSSRRKIDSSPPSQRLSSSRRNRVSNDLLLDNVTIYKLLDEISKHKDSWPFVRPVSRSEVPDYYKVIKNPMDLAKIKSKLNMGKYSSNYEVMNDIQLIFENCDLYNQNDSEIYVAGANLETFVFNRSKELNLAFKTSDMISGAMKSSYEVPAKKKRQK